MGKNKDIRKQIAGLKRNILKHQSKIREEMKTDFPDEGLLRKWKGEIERDENRIEFLGRRLKRRGNYADREKI